ncbi:lipid II:glycine glycyltransferase FemX [Actinomyces weissii]|nr:GNAT family N-acetyltransferase [Actinomyces weissii]
MGTNPETADRTETLRRVDAKQMRIAAGCTPVAIEQTEAWERFERSQGRPVWGRYLYEEGEKAVATIALYPYKLGGSHFLWAKHGPTWFREQSPQREAHLRRLLVQEVRRREPSVVFIRMHARYQAPDLHELASTITYDRTYVIDLSGKTPEAISDAMPRDGRRGVRRAQRVAQEAGCTIAEETGLSRAEFAEVYEVLAETARRDGFSAHPMQTYWSFLNALGPEHARLFVLRKDGVPHAWDIVTTVGKDAVVPYGASSNESRKFRAAEALDWWVACQLAQEGFRGMDLMGADSARVPELYTVGQYKRRYAQHPTEVDGAWDVPVRPALYQGLLAAKKGRDLARGLRERVLR